MMVQYGKLLVIRTFPLFYITKTLSITHSDPRLLVPSKIAPIYRLGTISVMIGAAGARESKTRKHKDNILGMY